MLKYSIKNDEEYNEKILEPNIFADKLSTFSLLTQISIDDNKKYFIFGIKFKDVYVPNKQINEAKNIFIYEKTYLFIATQPLCSFFEKIFNLVLKHKKLIFFQNLPDYSNLCDINAINKYNELNSENVSNIFL